MNRLKKIFTKIFPYDKLLHYVLGIYIALLTLPFIAWWLSLILVFFVALIIEVNDKISKKGTPEILDIIYTVMGGGSVIVLDLLKKIAYAIFN